MKGSSHMSEASPVSVPTLALVRGERFEMGVSSVDVYPQACGVRGRVVALGIDAPEVRIHATGPRGAAITGGSSAHGDDGSFDFVTYFNSALEPGDQIVVTGATAELDRDLSLTITESPPRALASLRVIEPAGSPRWPEPGVAAFHGFERVRVLNAVFDLRSDRVLPDKVVPLGASIGGVGGHRLTFLSAERWGEVWWLHHCWENPSAMYSPLRGDLEIVMWDQVMTALHLGGGTTPNGVAYRHAFVTAELPHQFRVRLPAPDFGSPLVEVEMTVA
jgi:hypothetical protein